ncbi:MAG: hypothetical protein ACYDB7_04970 [Mycobacteriales bacterium]
MNSTYEIDEGRRRFRLLAGSGGPGMTSGDWSRFERMSPVRPGEPVRFFQSLETVGALLRFSTVTTTRVVDVWPSTAESFAPSAAC